MRKPIIAKMPPNLKPLLHQTKTQALRDRLLTLVRTMQPDEKLPTMRQLQDSLAVSPMTLHRALSELEAHKLIYRRQGSGTYVAPRPENMDRVLDSAPTIGLVYNREIFDARSSPAGSLLVEEARRRATEHNERFSLYLASPVEDENPVHDDLREAVELGRLRGVLYAGASNPRALDWLREHNVPVVSLSYGIVASPRVKIDHAQLVRLGVETLAKKGCKRIALWIPLGAGIGRRDGAKSFPELDAWRNALKKHGLEIDESLVWRNQEHTDQTPHNEASAGEASVDEAKSSETGGARETNQAQGLRAAREVFGEKNATSSTRLPDGIVIDDDMMTRGALTYLGQHNIKIGEDLQIATHLNRGSDVLLGHEDELSLLEIDLAQMAQAMFETLETLMRGAQPQSEVIEIKAKLRA